jgi:hypothetical protein
MELIPPHPVPEVTRGLRRQNLPLLAGFAGRDDDKKTVKY